MDEGAFDESMMFTEYHHHHHQKSGSPQSHQHVQPLLNFQQASAGDLMGYATTEHMTQEMHGHQQQQHHQLQDMDLHRHHHMQDHHIHQDRQQLQMGGDPQDLFQLPVATSTVVPVQSADATNGNGQKHIKLEMDPNSLPGVGQQTSGKRCVFILVII